MSTAARRSVAGDERLPTENESAASLVASSANVAEMAHAERGPSTGVPAGTQATPQDPSAASNELHVQIEAPFVFHPTGPPPAPVEDVRALPLDSRPRAGTASDAPPPPVAVETPRAAALRPHRQSTNRSAGSSEKSADF